MKINTLLATMVLSLLAMIGCFRGGECPFTDLSGIRLVPSELEVVHRDSLVKSVRFIPLETSSECLIERYDEIQIDDSNIFILSKSGPRHAIFIFDMEGNYVSKLDAQGRGPGEFLYISSFTIDPLSEHVIIFDHRNAIFYDYKGNFVRRHSFNDVLFPGESTVLFNNMYYSYAEGFEVMPEYTEPAEGYNTVAVFDGDLNLLSHTFPRKGEVINTPFIRPGRNMLTRGEDNLYLFDHLANVLYAAEESVFVPRYHLDFGEHSVSVDKLFDLLSKSDGDYMSYLRENNLCYPGRTRIHAIGDYFIIYTVIGNHSHSFIYDTIKGESYSINLRVPYCTFNPNFRTTYSNGTYLFDAIDAFQITTKLKECEERLAEGNTYGPFCLTCFAGIDQIAPDDNAIIVIFELKDDFFIK